MILMLVRTCAALLLVGAEGSRAQGLPGPVVSSGFGVNIHFTRPVAGEMERFAEAGFRLARMDFAWAAVEKAEGRYDFAPYDGLVAHLARAGARPLFILDYGHPRYDGGRSPRSDEARRAFARFAGVAAGHFRGQGVLWEIWNEPNHPQFWKPEPDAEAYAALAIEAVKAIRAADPQAVVLAPASSEFPWDFFEKVFRAGLLEHVDAVSVHPYRDSPPETAARDYGRLRALIARHAPAAKRDLPIVCSEWGYSTFEEGISEARQAQYLARIWLANLASGVNVSIFYDWRDDGDDPREREHRFGTVRRDFTRKPSFAAAKALIAALDGYAFRHRLAGGDGWQLLFQRGDGDELALASWSEAPKSPDDRQAPSIRRVTPREPDFPALRRLASIHYDAGPRAEGDGQEAVLEITIRNPETRPARIGVAPEGQGAAIDVAVTPGESERRRLTLAVPRLRASSRSVAIPLTWDGQALPAVAPLEVWRTDPLSLTASPRGSELEVAVEGASRQAWAGRLVVSSAGKEVAAATIRLPEGEGRSSIRVPRPEGWHEVSLLDGAGGVVARLGRRRFEALAPFPAGYSSVLYVENAPRAPEPLRAVAAPPGSPAREALAFRYRFDRGWRYAVARPSASGTIPAGARAMALWVRGDGAQDALRARFRDATGQAFQVDVGTTEGTEWRPLSIPLDGSGRGAHWGGANDGVPHGPLAWEGLLLIDSTRRDVPHTGELLVAAPSYVFLEE